MVKLNTGTPLIRSPTVEIIMAVLMGLPSINGVAVLNRIISSSIICIGVSPGPKKVTVLSR